MTERVSVETDRPAYSEHLDSQELPRSEVLGFQPNPDTHYQTGDIAECLPLEDVFRQLAETRGIPVDGWDIIVFRSTLNPAASETTKAALWDYDAAAYSEAITKSGGSLLDYFKGFADSNGRNMSMCIWDNKDKAHQTLFGEKHQLAVTFARQNKAYLPGSVNIEEHNAKFIAGELVLVRIPRGKPQRAA